MAEDWSLVRSAINGMQIRTNILITVPFEDWSKVRSPSRARRRMKYGHRQNVVRIQVPDPKVFVTNGVIHGHPETIKKMLAEIERRKLVIP